MSLILHVRKALYAFSKLAENELITREISQDVQLHTDMELYTNINQIVQDCLSVILEDERNTCDDEHMDSVVAILQQINLEKIQKLNHAKEIKHLRKAIIKLPDEFFRAFKADALLGIDQNKVVEYTLIHHRTYDIFLMNLRDFVVSTMFVRALRTSAARTSEGTSSLGDDGARVTDSNEKWQALVSRLLSHVEF